MLHVRDATNTGRMKTLARQHPVAMFLFGALTLTFAVQIPPMLAVYGVIPGKTLPSRFGLDMEEAASALGVIALFAVTLTVTALEGGRAAVMVLLRRIVRWRVSPRWWLVAVAALPLGTIALAVALGDTASLPTSSTLASELVSAGIALLCINLWEEAAWAGFLQSRLERDHNFIAAAFITAVPFAAVHLPLRVITGEATTVAGLASAFVVLMVFLPIIRIMFGCMMRGAGNSVLIVAATHTAFNRSNNTDGIAADVLSGDARQIAALLMTVAVTVVVLIATRHSLARTKRAALDAAEVSSTSRKDAAGRGSTPHS